MKKYLRVKFALVCLLAFVFPNVFHMGVLAASVPSVSSERQPAEIIETAGMNGYYEYNAYTKEETFVPASEYMPVSLSLDTRETEEKPCDPSVLETNYTEYYEDDENEAEGILNSEIQPFGVMGSDDRVAVGSVTGSYTHVCLIVARFPNNQKDYGTGFLIDNNHVATAAHLVYKKEWGGYADHFAIYAGSNNGTYKKYSLAHWYKVGGDFVKEYDDYAKAKFDDWAIVTCDSSMSGVGYFGLKVANSADDMDYEYTTAGYPGPLNEDEFNYPVGNMENLIQYKMYRTTGTVMHDEMPPVTRMLPVVSMNIDIERGQSGSPVYRNVSGKGNCVQAIIICEVRDGWGSMLYNSAILINDWLYNAMTT